MTPVFTAPAFGPVLPEIILAAGTLLLVLVGAFRGERSAPLVTGAALGLLIVALIAIWFQPAARIITLNGSFIVDGFARFMKALALLGSIAILVMSGEYLRRERIERFEFPILILLATIGMMMMISANDLLALYLGLELLSLASYVIASFHRDNELSTEAGLKYFILGSLASGMLLYGASLVYGFTGTISFPGITTMLKTNAGIGAILGLVFVSAGVAFKISAAPFHMWTPDVYEGSPTPVTTFFASAPKIAAMALAVRVYYGAFPSIVGEWQQIVAFLAIASVLLGAFAAIGQRNIKRLMAYSAIGNVGFTLIGLVAGTPSAVQSVMLYMAIYLAMTLGTFACILAMRRGGIWVEQIDDLAGLARTHPFMAFCFATMMFSLAGIPPLAGFFAKFYVFAAAVQAGFAGLAVIGVLASVIGAFYYLRIVKIMYFDEARERFEPMSAGGTVVLVASSAFILLFWLVPAPLVAAAGAAARGLF